MVNLYIYPHEQMIITVDQSIMFVKTVLVKNEGHFIQLQDWKPPSDLIEVEMILVRHFSQKKLLLPRGVNEAILYFFHNYHAKQDLSFDCYAFANLVKGVTAHKVPYMLSHWKTRPKPWFIPVGSVVFLESGLNQFHHAAIYIGRGLYLSVWGAGGDLEVATLNSMKRDYGAERVMLAEPQ